MDPDILRQRRNLIGLSVALSLFELAGGELTKSSLFFGVLTFKNTGIVLTLAWASLFYFLWRYWLHLKPIRNLKMLTHNGNVMVTDERHFLCNLQRELAENPSYRKLAEALYNSDKANEIPADPYSPLLVTGLFSRKLDFTYLSPIPGRGGQMRNGRPNLKVPYMEILPIEMKARIKTIFRYSSFSDFILPYWLSLTPLLIVAYKQFLTN